MILKTCPDCGQSKPHDEFATNRARPDGLAFYCRPCFSVRSAATYRRTRARQGHTVRERIEAPDGHKACADCREVKPLEAFDRAPSQAGGRNCYCKPCRARRSRAERFLRVYGLTDAQLADLVDSQGGRCAVCQDAQAIHVDHDHNSGAVRSVLCFACNVALGHFKDRVHVLRAAADYLDRTTWQKRRLDPGVYRLDPPPPLIPPRPLADLQPLLSLVRG